MKELSKSGVNEFGISDAYVCFERRGLVMEENLTDIVSLSQFNSVSHPVVPAYVRGLRELHRFFWQWVRWISDTNSRPLCGSNTGNIVLQGASLEYQMPTSTGNVYRAFQR